MTLFRYIVSVIAIFSSLLYLGNIIMVLSADQIDIIEMKKNNPKIFEDYARFRLILSIIMSLSIGYLIAC